MLVEGKWLDKGYDTEENEGKFIRSDAGFRNWITTDGSAGPSGKAGFKAEKDRYHLYISLACPWAHRTAIFRKIKGLEKIISISIVHWYMGENGWTFNPGPNVIADTVNRANYLHQIYTAAVSDYSGRVTVPVVWDKKLNTIVSNESSEIIRMFNSAFDDIGAKPGDYYPYELREKIDHINKRIYDNVNNGVYKSGFATTQKAYEDAVLPLFQTLDWIDSLLENHTYLTGERITEADWRLFTTLVRFDSVYAGHFKCNIKRIKDYNNIFSYLRRLYQIEGVAETVNMEHIKHHYYVSHDHINPTGIVPIGPVVEYTT